MRLVVGMTGASGAVYGIRLLQALRELGVDTHLVASRWGERTIQHETSFTLAQVRELATEHHGAFDQAASISSGSFRTDGMAIVPCSARTAAAIAHGVGDTLVCRAADVTLKEGRKLVLVVRETPLSPIHLDNLLTLARLGAVVLPPVPAFYNHPETIDDLVDDLVVKVLDQFGLPAEFGRRWGGRLERRAGDDDA
ncbi:MAG: flavin prenyltransferase [Solirubrobacteraceae bacterium]|nr:flavin prenyltransferase [Solirubrobacteraceae bacterium]MEA2359057.1 flavin prenyltransferase [Solirubrobacteraceae bacterium]